MEGKQCIKCDVCACMHNCEGSGCELSSITVTNASANETAHYCGSYCEK